MKGIEISKAQSEVEDRDKKLSVKHHKPLHDGILVESYHVAEKTTGGIIKPTEVVEREKNTIKDDKFRKVVAVGPECKNIKVGDLVSFGRATPFFYPYAEGDYMQYFEHQVVAIWSEEEIDLVDNSSYVASFRAH